MDQAFKRDSEYARTLGLVCERERILLDAVNKEHRPLVEACTDAQTALSCLAEKAAFAYGYRLGILTMVEVFATEGPPAGGAME